MHHSILYVWFTIIVTPVDIEARGKHAPVVAARVRRVEAAAELATHAGRQTHGPALPRRRRRGDVNWTVRAQRRRHCHEEVRGEWIRWHRRASISSDHVIINRSFKGPKFKCSFLIFLLASIYDWENTLHENNLNKLIFHSHSLVYKSVNECVIWT
jgi:hypothetical protein